MSSANMDSSDQIENLQAFLRSAHCEGYLKAAQLNL